LTLCRTIGCGGCRYGTLRRVCMLLYGFSIIAQLTSRSLCDTISNTVQVHDSAWPVTLYQMRALVSSFLLNIVNLNTEPRHEVVSIATLSRNNPPGDCEYYKMPAKHRALLPVQSSVGQKQTDSQSSQQYRAETGKIRKTSACQRCRQKKRQVCTALPINVRF
jgi:hypothetical protein